MFIPMHSFIILVDEDERRAKEHGDTQGRKKNRKVPCGRLEKKEDEFMWRETRGAQIDKDK